MVENEKLVNIPPIDPMDFCGVVCNFAEELIEKAKSKAYKEFAERLKEELSANTDNNGDINSCIVPIVIDNLLKERGYE